MSDINAPDENRIDGVITLEEHRVFRAQGVVAGPSLDCAEFMNPVPVWDGSRVIGYANLERRQERVVASFSLHYNSPERLLLELGTEPLYAHAVVAVLMDPEGCVKEVRIQKLVLDRERQDDQHPALEPA